MSRILPVSVESLFAGGGVESERIQFNASWDPRIDGQRVLRTICAFANDYQNLNGGYIVIGVEEVDGHVRLPPIGIEPNVIENARHWIRRNCKRLDPAYRPLMSPERFKGRDILVIWVPASEIHPHSAPSDDKKTRKYWIRVGAETVDAETAGMLTNLIGQAAKLPWDDRRSIGATSDDLRGHRVREYLRVTRSGLLDEKNLDLIYKRLMLTKRVSDCEVPRNIGLLLFTDDPTVWFPSARIEAVVFADDGSGDVQEERVFVGSLLDQIDNCVKYLRSIASTRIEKQSDHIHAKVWISYPIDALRESLVNAVYHRSYQPEILEPTKVYLYPNRIEFISYPGPVPGIDSEHFLPDSRVPPMPARNRRVGEFLKELRLAEGRLTGISKIYRALRANGSPPPKFDFDKFRSYFRTTIYAHSEYAAIMSLRDITLMRVLGDHERAKKRLQSAWSANPNSSLLASELIRQYVEQGELGRADEVYDTFKLTAETKSIAAVRDTYHKALIEAGETEIASTLLDSLPPDS